MNDGAARKHMERVNRYRRFDALSPALGLSMRRYFRVTRRPVGGYLIPPYSLARLQEMSIARGISVSDREGAK